MNSFYTMLPFGELYRCQDWLFKSFGLEDCIFVRPSTATKSFTGQILERVDLEREVKKLAFKVDPESLIIVAPPVNIVREWRLVVSDHVVASSQYKEGKGFIRITGSDIVKIRNAPAEVVKYGEKILSEVKYKPNPIWTLDVCETEGGDLKVLEVGSFSCAGLYACDPEPIIDEVNRIATKMWEVETVSKKL